MDSVPFCDKDVITVQYNDNQVDKDVITVLYNDNQVDKDVITVQYNENKVDEDVIINSTVQCYTGRQICDNNVFFSVPLWLYGRTQEANDSTVGGGTDNGPQYRYTNLFFPICPIRMVKDNCNPQILLLSLPILII